MNNGTTYTLVISCPDQRGIVAAVSSFIAAHQGSIVEADYHTDRELNRFFMRQEILAESLSFTNQDEFRQKFKETAKKFKMEWKITSSAQKKRTVVLVSQEDHCLADLLYRWRAEEFDFDIVAVISNHETTKSFVEWHNIPFHYIPMSKENKGEAFGQIEALFKKYQGDVMVLARFMQIVPADLCERLYGRIINIHHSFLPSFVGGKPYHQAYERGVKLIGATCHYATAVLDEGPIIEQDVIRVDHSHSIPDMIRLGKDVEKMVLARGLRYHVEDRVIIHQNKTIVFK
ncbi:MAG: formyltetrahydrofolate deformylase [Deltaproteobacteria bacterium]|nr:formyltetrahydrofolate deformylase [Deltaproteobacteria bacterium]